MTKFDYFVLFADMRTGSNFLEANLNIVDGLSCVGEAFNPHFIGYPKSDNILGITLPEREQNPQQLIDAIKGVDGLSGFRFFNDHDPRILNICLPDPRCAKIILTRNPVDSYVSWKIAQSTGQWKLTNVTRARTDQITFDPAEFDDKLAETHAFQLSLLNQLQQTGQSAFYISYDDLHNLDILNGLLKYLDIPAEISALDKKLKKQNPVPMSDKVSNFDTLEKSLSKLDHFNIQTLPSLEPRRGPNIPTYIAAAQSGVLYLPLKSGPDQHITNWLGHLDDNAGLQTGFTQKTLRIWKQNHPHHRSFTVLRHPLARAHKAFCDVVVPPDNRFMQLRKKLRNIHNINGPKDGEMLSISDHRQAFLAFLKFLKASLLGQTSIRIDPAWASQTALLQGFTQFAPPDLIAREDRLQDDLDYLVSHLPNKTAPKVSIENDETLVEIYDPIIEDAAQSALGRDYLSFGFKSWR